MPQVRAERFIRIDPETAFAFSQTTGSFRLKWDPFISAQGFLDGAEAPGKGVRTRTRSRLGLAMVSQYVSYAPRRSPTLEILPSGTGVAPVTLTFPLGVAVQAQARSSPPARSRTHSESVPSAGRLLPLTASSVPHVLRAMSMLTCSPPPDTRE